MTHLDEGQRAALRLAAGLGAAAIALLLLALSPLASLLWVAVVVAARWHIKQRKEKGGIHP